MTRRIFFLSILGIFLVTLALRVYRFPSLPIGLNRDEMALGYNAFSLFKSGRDEWGKSWPIVFRSFGDYKLAGYIYAIIPFVAALGLNETAVRLPSLLAGLALPFAVAFLVHTLTKNKTFSLLSALMIAFSPWAIFYSRVGFEANLALTLFVFGLTFMLKSFKSRKFLSISLGVFFLSFLTYNSPLLLVPALIMLIVLVYQKKALLPALGILVAAVSAFAIVFPAIKGKGTITLFGNPQMFYESQQKTSEAGNNPWLKFLAKPKVYTATALTTRYLATFTPHFVVSWGGSNPWQQVRDASYLSWSIYLLAILGVMLAIHNRKHADLFLLGLLLLSPLPSAVTVDAPHATRALLFFVIVGIFAARGLTSILKRAKLLALAIIALVCLETGSYMMHYQKWFETEVLPQWNPGVQEALNTAEQLHAKTDLPIAYFGFVQYTYISALFYGKVDPNEYRSTVQYYPDDAVGLSQVKSFGHYMFMADEDDLKEKAIVIEQDLKTATFSVEQN